MPFTFSYPAIVLPLTYLPRRWFSLTGLIIGSLTPDFEDFDASAFEEINIKRPPQYFSVIDAHTEGYFLFQQNISKLIMQYSKFNCSNLTFAL